MSEAPRNECTPPPPCSALDFQSAPYEALCGCVAVMISESYGKMLDRVSEEDRRRLVKNLLDSSQGYRNVCANCPTCGGSGILPNMDLPITEADARLLCDAHEQANVEAESSERSEV